MIRVWPYRVFQLLDSFFFVSQLHLRFCFCLDLDARSGAAGRVHQHTHARSEPDVLRWAIAIEGYRVFPDATTRIDERVETRRKEPSQLIQSSIKWHSNARQLPVARRSSARRRSTVESPDDRIVPLPSSINGLLRFAAFASSRRPPTPLFFSIELGQVDFFYSTEEWMMVEKNNSLVAQEAQSGSSCSTELVRGIFFP